MKVLLIGDSIMLGVQIQGAHMGFSADHSIGSNGTQLIANGHIVYCIANSGDRFENQKTAFDSWLYRADPTLGLIVIYCGTNNAHTPQTTAVSVGHCNDLLRDLRATAPQAKIILCSMTGARLWENDRSLNHGLNQALNRCISRAGMDTGATAIDAVDALVLRHAAALTTPDGFLITSYDATPAGIDRGLHPNAAGDLLIATYMQEVIEHVLAYGTHPLNIALPSPSRATRLVI